jgi:hypothetical protein
VSYQIEDRAPLGAAQISAMTIKQETPKFTLRRWLLAVAPFGLVGIIDLILAWYKRDLTDAIVVCLIFFIAAPMFSIWWSRQDWMHE